MVSNTNGSVSVKPVASKEQLMDVTFTLLGNSTQDLFFPANFLVVEGAFDQAICEKVASLLGITPWHVKVLSSAGRKRELKKRKIQWHWPKLSRTMISNTSTTS